MSAQESASPGNIQYLPFGDHQIRARVTWTLEDGPKREKEKSSTIRRQDDVQFHAFSRLPLELRLRIWDYSSPPRIIEIRSWGNTTRINIRPIKFSIPPQKLPLIFHINHESRAEALRRHTLVSIGISASTLDPNQEYMDWKHHPVNPYRQFYRPAPTNRQYLATPYPAQKVYVNWEQDTIYLGPEFQSQHLRSFFTATGPKMELAGLKYLAIDRKLFLCQTDTNLDCLLTSLHSLLSRPIKEIYIIPDDTRDCLEDKFYYCEHEISFQDPFYTYTFRLSDDAKEMEKTFIDNLRVWLERMWKEEGKDVPKLEIKSVRRNGRCLASFKNGLWDVQKVLAGMDYWKEWSPLSDTL